MIITQSKPFDSASTIRPRSKQNLAISKADSSDSKNTSQVVFEPNNTLQEYVSPEKIIV